MNRYEVRDTFPEPGEWRLSWVDPDPSIVAVLDKYPNAVVTLAGVEWRAVKRDRLIEVLQELKREASCEGESA